MRVLSAYRGHYLLGVCFFESSWAGSGRAGGAKPDYPMSDVIEPIDDCWLESFARASSMAANWA